MSIPLSFKEYIKYLDDEDSSKTKKKLNKKSPKGRYYGGISAQAASAGNGDGSMGEGAALPSTFSSVRNMPYGNDKVEDEEMDDEMSDDEMSDDEMSDDEMSDDEMSDDEMSDDEMSDDEMSDDEIDPDRQGVIRVVKGAHLVYKRQDEDGLYDELWIFNVDGKLKDELEVRRDIIAGTDIKPGKVKSQDGNQTLNMWTVGNVQFLHISGLPN